MTAAKPARKLTSPKYPGWSIERLSPTAYLMVRDAGIYAIAVTHSKSHGWAGELLTNQAIGWAPAKTPFTHCVMGVVREADRRFEQIAKRAR